MAGPVAPEELEVSEVCEGGNLDCGSGLLLLIRKAMHQVPEGEVLEIRSTEISVREDLPAWCRMTENPYLAGRRPKTTTGSSSAGAAATRTPKKTIRKPATTAGAPASTGTARRPPRSTAATTPGGGPARQLRPPGRGAQRRRVCAGRFGRVPGRRLSGPGLPAERRGGGDGDLLECKDKQHLRVFRHRAEGHSGFEAVEGTVYVQSDADEVVLEELWRKTVAASPVANSLVRGVEVNVGIKVV